MHVKLKIKTIITKGDIVGAVSYAKACVTYGQTTNACLYRCDTETCVYVNVHAYLTVVV